MCPFSLKQYFFKGFLEIIDQCVYVCPFPILSDAAFTFNNMHQYPHQIIRKPEAFLKLL